MGKLDGKVAIVTGAASDIPRAVALAFVAEGARVYLADQDSDRVGALIGEIGHNYADGMVIDLTDESAVQKMVAGCVRRFGRLNVAFNATVVAGSVPIRKLPADAFRQAVAASLTGTFLCLKHEAQQLIDAGLGGSIINAASADAMLMPEGSAAAASAAAAVTALTQVAALEFRAHNVRVNSIGLVLPPDADATPEPPDVPALTVFLASDDSAPTTGEVFPAQ